MCCRWPNQSKRSRTSLWQTKKRAEPFTQPGWGITMVHRVSLALTAVLLSSATAATAAELPTFEITGFPLTDHQVTVLNSGIVQERSPAPSLTLASMPASPVQIGVLTPRPKQEFAAKEDSPAHN